MEHFVKMAEIKIVANPGMLKTVVGSCIALFLWDKKTHVGGLAHIMMPECQNDKDAAKGKYADTAVDALIAQMKERGCKTRNMIAICTGGASMFSNRLNQKTNQLSIGERNYQVVKKLLKDYGIPIECKEIGGTSGRRVAFNCVDGRVKIKTLNDDQ